jgi:hypothetical protein
LGCTQCNDEDEFALMIGASPRTIQNWEQKRRESEGAAKAPLMVAARHPKNGASAPRIEKPIGAVQANPHRPALCLLRRCCALPSLVADRGPLKSRAPGRVETLLNGRGFVDVRTLANPPGAIVALIAARRTPNQ